MEQNCTSCWNFTNLALTIMCGAKLSISNTRKSTMVQRSQILILVTFLLSDSSNEADWGGLSEAEQRNINEQLSSFLNNNDLKSLPVHSRESRTSSCSEDPVQEIIHYR